MQICLFAFSPLESSSSSSSPPTEGLSWDPFDGRTPTPSTETTAEIRCGCENNDTLIVKLPFSRLRCREQTQRHMKEQSLHWLHPWYLGKAKSFCSNKAKCVVTDETACGWAQILLIIFIYKYEKSPVTDCSQWSEGGRLFLLGNKVSVCGQGSCFWATERRRHKRAHC